MAKYVIEVPESSIVCDSPEALATILKFFNRQLFFKYIWKDHTYQLNEDQLVRVSVVQEEKISYLTSEQEEAYMEVSCVEEE